MIPSVSRIMKFRTTVRRNTPGGSCNAYTDVTLTTERFAGPFVVTYPQGPFIGWVGKTAQTITWNVANTNLFPIFTRYVDILLSIDGGNTYPYTVLNDVENTGSREICVPNLTSNTARIMVRSKNGTFFNISNTNFSIAAISAGAPILSDADRNGMETREAFIKIAGCLPLSNDVYTINGIPGATIRFDALNQRFIVGNITTPRRVVVTITATDANNISRTSNPITIPSIL